MGKIAAIPTRYASCLFRSRIEARWAVYFDRLKIKWVYEPQGYKLSDGTFYLPDFFLPQVNMLAEVKPEWPNDDEMRKISLLYEGTGIGILILDGAPLAQNYWIYTGPEFIDYQSDCFVDDQFLEENRFFSGTGGATHPRESNPDKSAIRACEIARGYRFDLEGGGNG